MTLDDKSERSGGPAFTDVHGEGMTLRDWFAGQALIGLLAGEASPVMAATRKKVATERGMAYTELLAAEVYAIADDILACRQAVDDRLSEPMHPAVAKALVEILEEAVEESEALPTPEHRCGVRGFADSGDVCPGCAASGRHRS